MDIAGNTTQKGNLKIGMKGATDNNDYGIIMIGRNNTAYKLSYCLIILLDYTIDCVAGITSVLFRLYHQVMAVHYCIL